MKYIILVGDGMGDRPLKELNDKTPLDVAKTPNIDFLCQHGECGRVVNTPDSLPPGSDVALLSIFGYDPVKYYSGRGPLEAASLGVALGPHDVAFRCNLVTVKDGVMEDYSAGHIETAEARQLITALNEKLGSEKVQFYPGISYRHLVVVKDGTAKILTTPPHDISGRKIDAYLPKGEDEALILELMAASKAVLADHSVNRARRAKGKRLASQIWLWGQGSKPALPTYREHFGLRGAVITAVDLIKGIGTILGLEVINVPGATGYLDTNYKGKAEYALDSLKNNDFVLVHVEAPDEAGHNGDIKGKIQAIEDFDRLVVGTVFEGVEKGNMAARILVTPDHATPIGIKTHARDPVPFVIYDTEKEFKSPVKKYCEREFANLPLFIKAGYMMIERLIGGSK